MNTPSFVIRNTSVSVHWLSLEKCMNRILKKLERLKLYFLSEEWADERFQRLHRWFSNLLLETALMFQTNAISIFTNFQLSTAKR